MKWSLLLLCCCVGCQFGTKVGFKHPKRIIQMRPMHRHEFTPRPKFRKIEPKHEVPIPPPVTPQEEAPPKPTQSRLT